MSLKAGDRKREQDRTDGAGIQELSESFVIYGDRQHDRGEYPNHARMIYESACISN